MEGVNSNLDKLLHCLINDQITKWDLVLRMAELSYNKSIIRPTRIPPFEAKIRVPPRLLVDLAPLLVEAQPSGKEKEIIHHMQQVLDEVQGNIATSNESYK